MTPGVEAVPLRGRRLPAALMLAGFVLKVALSILVGDTVGTWVGGALGFASLVAGGVLAWRVRRDADRTSGGRGRAPEAETDVR